jgi:hypothetical protein
MRRNTAGGKWIASAPLIVALAAGIAIPTGRLPGHDMVSAQTSGPSAPERAGATESGPAPQHGAQPNPQDVRPGTRDGDAPSASAGTLARRNVERRILGLPVGAAIVIGGALVVLAVAAGLAVPSVRRREKAQGGGTYGEPRDPA